MIGLAFARRLASFQVALARDLGLPPPRAAAEIEAHLIRFPTNCTDDGGAGRCERNDPNASWVSFGNATVTTSDDFSLYPAWPTEYVSIGSDEALRRTARRTIQTYVSPAEFVSKRPVLTFPAAVRAGFSATDPDESAGLSPEVVMAGLKAWLGNTEHKNGVMQDRDDGRVEDCGVMRAVNEMLLQAPNDGSFIELFPFFPANESASFTTLRAKGGWLVTASKAAATVAELAGGGSGVVSGVEVTATVDGTARLVDPWAASSQLAAVACTPAPAAPAVSRVSAGGRSGLLGWAMKAGQTCSVRRSPESLKSDDSDTDALPRPTPQQLQWQSMEIGALVHFQMFTFDNNTYSADPSLFQPAKLDIDQWVQSFVDLGVKEAVLTVKHGSGFTLYPSNATMPDGHRYNYSTAYSSWRDGHGDVVAEFIKACNKRGIGVGYYYSIGANQFAVSHGWSPKQLEEVEKQQLRELFATAPYDNRAGGNKGLTEIWFDGGFNTAMKPFLTQLLAGSQPQAIVYNGCIDNDKCLPHEAHPGCSSAQHNISDCVTRNSVKWIGNENAKVATEFKHIPDEDWSTGWSGGGAPPEGSRPEARATLFQPTEIDYTLQNEDRWGYDGSVGNHNLTTLQEVYHVSVGRNGFLMMDFGPDKDGLIAPDQVAAYRRFGDWIRSCYGSAVAATLGTVARNGTLHLRIPQNGSRVDRVMMREDQTMGQIIRGYDVEAQSAAGSWTRVASGLSIGNKRIDVIGQGLYAARALRLRVTALAPGLAAAKLTHFGAYAECSDGGAGLRPFSHIHFTGTG